jgi:hypothetical protein
VGNHIGVASIASVRVEHLGASLVQGAHVGPPAITHPVVIDGLDASLM